MLNPMTIQDVSGGPLFKCINPPPQSLPQVYLHSPFFQHQRLPSKLHLQQKTKQKLFRMNESGLCISALGLLVNVRYKHRNFSSFLANL
ncbi:hypothetical protein XENTR_v10024958 [Xenopus tropicalis]|nr:hypothetical protein XENTR_v10024958 [Xenopus tropicalis]